MSFDARVWAADVSEYDLWSQDERGRGLIRTLLPGDEAAQSKVTRFVREADQIRSLCARLMVRLAVCESFPLVSWDELRFVASPEGRPYLQTPRLAFDYNITHDGDWVAIVYAVRASTSEAPPSRPVLGIDVMEIHLPSFEQHVYSFAETMDMTLTRREREWIQNDNTPHPLYNIDPALLHRRRLSADAYARLVRLYTLWTYKEAFTKAHGIGLSFDFARIELAMWDRHRDDEQGRTVLRTIPPSTSTLKDASRRKDDNLEALQTAVRAGVQQCVFRDVLLPAGIKHLRQTSESNVRPGMGTGFPSLLVVAIPRASANERQVPKFDILDEERSPSSSAGDAESLTYLQPRLWTMADLVEAAHACRGRVACSAREARQPSGDT